MGAVVAEMGHEHAGRAAGAETIESFAPASGELLGEAAVATPAEVRAAVGRARRAQQGWAALPVEERAERVLGFRDALVERADELVDLLVRECGKPRHEALLQEVMVVADIATYFAAAAPRLLRPREVPLHLMKHRRSFVHYVPRGVVAVISPWNYPLQMPLRDAIVALLAGNAVVLKPSEITPLVALKAKEIWDAAGAGDDLFQVVTGFGPTGAALVDAGVQLVMFTGGVATGRRVAAACGERLVPCILELGGKAPLVACADADIERTARAAVWGGFTNAGQACISVERVYAHREVHDRLLDRVVQLTRELTVGDPATRTVDVGALTFPAQLDIVERHVADALAKGARLECGGKRRSGAGRFYEPTVLSACDHTMTVMTQEIFGPVVPFMRVATDEEAIRLANESPLGLNAYVFTADRDHGRRVAERIEAGSVLVNDVVSNGGCPEVPFGGVKQSGFGRVLGDDSLRELCDVRHISVDRLHVDRDPFWFPYTDRGYTWFRRGLSALFGGGSIGRRLGRLF